MGHPRSFNRRELKKLRRFSGEEFAALLPELPTV
jgi:hypothetical protein